MTFLIFSNLTYLIHILRFLYNYNNELICINLLWQTLNKKGFFWIMVTINIYVPLACLWRYRVELTPNLVPRCFGPFSINVPNFIQIHQTILWTAMDFLCKQYNYNNSETMGGLATNKRVVYYFCTFPLIVYAHKGVSVSSTTQLEIILIISVL